MNLDIIGLSKINKDAIELNNYCDSINSKLELLNDVNNQSGVNYSNGIFKIQRFILSDFILLFEALNDKKNQNSLFVLAYYYDILRNNQIKDTSDLSEINKIVSSINFERNTLQILDNNLLLKETGSNGNPYFCFDFISKFNIDLFKFYQTFLLNTFDVNIESIKDLGKYLKLNIDVANSSEKVFPTDTLENTLFELNELIGLDEIKKNVNDLVNYLKVQKIRTREGLKIVDLSLHTVFYGPPGTGKTTLARLLGRIFKHLGFLDKGHVVETDRKDLVAGYVGQTAIKVDEVLDESIGGVLFIDEAYALTENASGNDFGSEAINTILKRMEDQREDFALIVAGYTEPMSDFINSNPGLKSRFNRYFYFKDFIPSELVSIFELFCKKSDFVLSEDAKEKLFITFELLYENKDESFGNARTVRNLFEVCIQNQANRLVGLKKHSKKLLKTFKEIDIPEPNSILKKSNI